jgi:hypothetical protein
VIEPDDVEEKCPLPACTGVLYLSTETCVPLPGTEAVSSAWMVICTEGHTVWTHVDQIRKLNAAGLTEDDEATDIAPEFRRGAVWWSS